MSLPPPRLTASPALTVRPAALRPALLAWVTPRPAISEASPATSIRPSVKVMALAASMVRSPPTRPLASGRSVLEDPRVRAGVDRAHGETAVADDDPDVPGAADQGQGVRRVEVDEGVAVGTGDLSRRRRPVGGEDVRGRDAAGQDAAEDGVPARAARVDEQLVDAGSEQGGPRRGWRRQPLALMEMASLAVTEATVTPPARASTLTSPFEVSRTSPVRRRCEPGSGCRPGPRSTGRSGPGRRAYR